MATLRARRGNTVLELNGNMLTVSIDQEFFGPFAVDAQSRQAAWRSMDGISVPLSVGGGSFGVGGTGHEIEVRAGMTAVTASWWMSPPSGWEPLMRVFDALRSLAPAEIVTRYDFGRGGE